MDVLVLTETKKKWQGQERLRKYHHMWSATNKSDRAKTGVSILIINKWIEKFQHWQEINKSII